MEGADQMNHEMFFEVLEKEILKVQNFTHKKVRNKHEQEPTPFFGIPW